MGIIYFENYNLNYCILVNKYYLNNIFFMKTKLLLLGAALSFSVFSVAQQLSQVQKATFVTQATSMILVPSISEQIANGTFIPAEEIDKEVNPKMRDANHAVPGKGLPVGPDPLWEAQNKVQKIKGKDPILTFQAASSNVTPTDPTGAVGPNHFVNAWNSSFRIWDKGGNPLTSPASLGTILNGNAGDPIVMYDPFADRFIITEFYSNGFGMAVCQGSDPVNNGWYLYTFNTNVFPDYPKFSVWSDGYYITANKNSGSAGSSEVVFAADRDKMLVGDPTATMIGFPLTGIVTNGFYSPLGFNCNGTTLPPPGDAPIVYMQDDSWGGVSTDHLKIWSINVNWASPGSSTISSPQIINTTPFDGLFDGGSFSNLPQPSGSDIDALQATIMYMAQYRRFPGYNSAIFNFVVDLDGGDDYAGIRWYELRQNEDGDPWTIYQEGTYAQPDGHSAFSGNMAMDNNGNIALAYTTVSQTMYPSLHYTGRFSTDPLGVMTLEEGVIATGTQSDPSTRYGDYSQMTVDPVDDQTFWSIGEYFNGGRKNQVGVFKIASALSNDVGVIDVISPLNGILTNAEIITVSVRNFGIDAQSGIPVSFQINGGSIVNEVISESVPGSTNVEYSFSATGDFSIVGETYELKVFTALGTDQNTINDTLVTYIDNLHPDDLGVSAVISPVSGSDLTGSESIIVTIQNYGGQEQENFDITYKLDGGSPVTEIVSDLIPGVSSASYTFNATGDFTALGNHQLMVYTSLEGDINLLNDTISVVITKEMCQPSQDCSYGDGFQIFELDSIYNASGCDPQGYGNYTDMIAYFKQGEDRTLTVTTGYGDQYVKVWIDYNDNFVFESDEVVVDNIVLGVGQGTGTYTESADISTAIDDPLGEHLLRAKSNWNASVPNDPCTSTQYGETEDYTVNIDLATSIQNIPQENHPMIVSSLGNNTFKLSYSSSQIKETLIVTVHDIYGNKLIQNRVVNNGGIYDYSFDMSHAAAGIYLVRLGSNTFGKVKRIVVK